MTFLRRVTFGRLTFSLVAAAAVGLLPLMGCSGGGGEGGGSPRYLSMGTAPSGGAFAPVGNAFCEVLNDTKGDAAWSIQPKGTKGSQENIRKLDKGELDFALSNASITYFAARGEGSFPEKKYDVRVVMTLAPNVAMFLTTKDSGIKTIADLKGQRVVVGPAGAGFEMFIEPILAAHDVSYDDFTPINGGQSDSVEYLADGSAAAAFLGGAPPTGSIIQACSSYDIFFVPFDEQARQKLINDYQFFKDYTLDKGVYSDLEADYPGLNVGSMHIITTADQDEDLVYEMTKLLYENRDEVTKKTKTAGNSIEKNATLQTGVPFHPGAIRYYKEAGIWPEEGDAAAPAETEGGDTEPTEEKPAASEEDNQN